MRVFLFAIALILINKTSFSQLNSPTDNFPLPLEKCNTYSELSIAIQLLKGSTEYKIEKAYDWIIDHIKYNHKVKSDAKYIIEKDLDKIVKSKKAICSEYVYLLNDLLGKMNIVSETVAGYCKSCDSDNEGFMAPSHVWNAVLVDSIWRMMDVTWDAELSQGRKVKNRKRSKKYFLKSSQEFMKDHLPAMPLWQLSDSMMTIQCFKKNEILNLDNRTSKGSKNDIDTYLSLAPIQKRLFEDRTTYQFNPTIRNKNTYGQNILDYASMLTDSLDESDRSNYSKNRRIRQDIIQLFGQAEELVIKLHTWQWEMYANIVINEIIDVYNNDPKMNWTDTEWKNLLNEITRARYILQKIENTYYKESSLAVCEEIENTIKGYID